MPDLSLQKYLLGTLSKDKSTEIELRVMEDEDFAAELLGVEEDLIEAFLSGELSEEDEARFRTDYLITNERIKNVEMTGLLLRHSLENVKLAEVSHSRTDESSSVLQWFSLRMPGLRLAAASLAVIAVVVTSLWFLSRPQADNELIALQNRYERLNQDPSAVSDAKGLSEITLVPETLRSAPSNAALTSRELTEDIRFQIALRPQTDTSASYDVTIYRDTTVVFRQSNITPLSTSVLPELRLILPRQIFTSGNYRAVVTNSTASETVYYFTVK